VAISVQACIQYNSCMKKRANCRLVFKECDNSQQMLLPPSLGELVDPNHPVRTVSRVIDELDISPIVAKYKGGGTSSYDPRMLLKVLVYGYLSNVFSSRKLENCLKENIHFMWISGMSRPDHHTINRFRSERLSGALKEVFSQVVMLLADAGHLSLKEVYIDGTKIEANANRYTFVWGRSIKYSEKRIAEQLSELWEYARKIAAEELEDTSDTGFTEIDPDKVRETIERIDAALANKPVDKKVKQKLNYAKKNWPKNLKRYEGQKETLGKRNSFSKTDHDATFMRMKEDHMRNGQLKPGYNLQISTNNQFIVNYTHHPNPTDTTTLCSHLEEFERLYEKMPEVVVADAGYGSEENYAALEALDIEAHIKYNSFDKEGKQKKRIDFNYDEHGDCYHCPAGRILRRAETYHRKTANGFMQEYVRYRSVGCDGCPLREQCCQGESNRTLQINHRLQAFKEKVRNNLTSEKGIYHRRRRGVEVESVFANIKHNKGFRRFALRGMEKTEIETGLIALSHNIAKMAA